MKTDLETFHILMSSRFPIVCLIFLAEILGTEIILIVKGRSIGAGRLEKQGFLRTKKSTSDLSSEVSESQLF